MRPSAIAVAAWATRQHDVVTVPQALRLGLSGQSVRRLVRSGEWRRLHRGVVWTRPVDGPPVLTALTAARLFAGGLDAPAGVVCSRSAARLWGLHAPDGSWRPELAMPTTARRPQPPGLRYRWPTLLPDEVVSVRGLPCTSIPRTLVDLASTAPYGERLIVADAALRSGLVDNDALSEIASTLPAGRRNAYRDADGRAESPFESLVRAEIIAAGLPLPVLQHEVRLAGRFVARVDFAWPALGVVAEADGASVHASAAALREDLRRQNLLVAAGLTVLRFTWSDLGRISRVLAAAFDASGRQPA